MRQYLLSTFFTIPELILPIFLRSKSKYSLHTLKSDAVAGATVALVQIPQVMAFSIIAGLPAAFGLYAAIAGCIAAVWGSSRHLVTGPVAIVSLLTFASVAPLAEPGSETYIRMVGTLSLLVGLVYLIMGFFRLGFIIEFVPHSVIVGFSSAGAFLITIAQIPVLLGLSVPQHDLALQNIAEIIFGIPHVSFITLVLSIGALLLLFFSRRLPRTIPGALILIAVGAAIGYVFRLDTQGVAMLHTTAQSLPHVSLPWFDPRTIAILLPEAAIIALVGYVGSHTTLKIASRTTKEMAETNQEMVGQGIGNSIAAFLQGFPIAGSLTRTMMNVEIGGSTIVSSLSAFITSILALLFLMPIFYFLPKVVLAAIVVFSAVPLIDIPRLQEMYRISKTDGFVAFLTFSMAFFLKSDLVILIGVIAALVIFIRQTVIGARVIEMGVDRELQILRSALDETSVDTFRGVAIARIAMSIYYANASHVVSGIEHVIKHHVTRERTPLKMIVLDVSSVSFIDITGIEVLQDYLEKLHGRDISIGLIYARRSILDPLERVPDFPKFQVFRNIADLRSSMLLTRR